MPVVYIIHADQDARFVEQQFVAPLAVLGVDGWVTPRHLAAAGVPAGAALAASAGVFAIVSAWAARDSSVREAIEAAARGSSRIVPVRRDDTPPRDVSAALESPAAVDLRRDATQPQTAERIARALRPQLADTGAGERDEAIQRLAVSVPWDPGVASALLADAVGHHDYGHGEALVARLAAWLERTGQTYDAGAAKADLKTLRRERQFPLMLRYASAVRASGIDDPTVARQHAQALIELGQYDEALDLLGGILHHVAPQHPESYEARGLLGRTFKQMYANAPAPAGLPLLERAIGFYYDAFREDPQLVWHGINAATCIRRAERDFGAQLVEPPERLARDILATLSRRSAEKGADGKVRPLDVWDLATRVEALVLLDDFDAAERALTEYLQHPDAHAFEVSATYRQFDQVLQLRNHDRGRGLVERLWQTVQRHRAPVAPRADRGGRVSALVNVTQPDWTPRVDGCDVIARLGTVIAVHSDAAALNALLDDPVVLGITESRRTGRSQECAAAVPFVGVPAEYAFPTGPELGANALVAVIDDGIDVLHEAFLDRQGKSRIVGVWDQRDPSGPPPPGFALGTYHDAAMIQGYVDTQTVPPALGRDPDGHGTHVASIAVGRAAGAFHGGVAPAARLLFVIADPRSPLGYSAEHVAALAFISEVADDLNLPVVVNVSQGMNAGAHDGRSRLERGFDNFSDFGAKPGRVIVKSAGNGGSANAHATIRVPTNSNAHVRWKRSPDPSWEYERIEFWWSARDTYGFVLVDPSGNRSAPVTIQQPAVSGTFDECPYRLEFVRRDPSNADSRLEVHLGLTDVNDAHVPEGLWTLEIEHLAGPGNLPIDAWIERGPVPASEFQQPYVSSSGSLTVPGTAHNVITVGAVQVGRNQSISDTYYTSRGPTRDGRSKPDVCAPGANVVAARSGTSNGAFADTGTSMAAPFVAGAVALLLSRAAAAGTALPTSAQVAAVLQEKTRNRNTTWNEAQGYGVIDAAALLAAFE